MNPPDFHPPALVATLESPSPGMGLAAAISADIRAVQSWRERELELATIRKFGENWDGYGSNAPSAAAMDAAALFLTLCKKLDYANAPARIALSPNGFLSVDWLDGAALVRAEVQDSNEIEWMKAIPGQKTEFFTTALTGQTGSRIEQVETWQPAEVVEDEPALTYAR